MRGSGRGRACASSRSAADRGSWLLASRAELRASVVMVDISERMVALARERGVDALVGTVEALPFADGSFDCAVAAWMLFHVPDLDRGLAELARVLRPGGIAFVAVTNAAHHLDALRELAGRAAWDAVFRVRTASRCSSGTSTASSVATRTARCGCTTSRPCAATSPR